MDAQNLRSVLELAGAQNLRPCGDTNFSMSCLFPWRHSGGQDARPSMTAYINPGGPSFLKCFSCGYVRPLTAAVRDLSNKTVGGRLADLADWVEKNELRGTGTSPHALMENRRDYTKQAKRLLNSPFPEEALQFLARKGVSDHKVISANLLWEPDKYLILFPQFRKQRGSTSVIGAQCRRPRDPEKGDLKYWHHWKYEARFHLYGEWLLPEWEGKTILAVEGQLDALHCWQERVPCVALMGKSLGMAKANLLEKHGIRRVVLVFDPDVHTSENGLVNIQTALDNLWKVGIAATTLRVDRDPKFYDRRTLRKILRTPLLKEGGTNGEGKETGEVDRPGRHQEQDGCAARSEQDAQGAGHDDGRGPGRRRPRSVRPRRVGKNLAAKKPVKTKPKRRKG